ncbi:hypothetical protein C9374_009897 [Naegleria lovaniensis]|uniref:Uncharacterized protein n=1 Tax=Naegleria lovaniensis TaxID=51637 RepID=A0AA88KGG5_NAELO|nr:uncharacterized protein C9374_009897 [Naegleria lovaniensis]KAG2375274.1 hypothetical protein C9374_009897 [Naegleria lovaniensis]
MLANSETGFRLATLDEDFFLDQYVEDSRGDNYTTTLYEIPPNETEDTTLGMSDNKGYFKLFNIQQNKYSIFKLFVQDDHQFIPLNTPWKQFKFIPYHPLSTPRTMRARMLMEEEMQQSDVPCYHETSSFKICFIQNFSNKVLFSTVHFGNSYFENDSIYARSCKVFTCGQHDDIITCIDADSDYLVSGTQNGDIKVWLHKEDSKKSNEDESFELYWTISKAHKTNTLTKLVILQSTIGVNRGTYIISGGGPSGILQIHNIQKKQSIQQIVLESCPLNYMKCFLPSCAIIACNDLGTVYLYSESESENTFLNLSNNYYILSDSKIRVTSATCFFMGNEIINVFAVIFLDDSNQIMNNSIRFYIGQLLVIEYSFETPILFCTVLNLKKSVNLKSSMPFAGSHLVACDKDGKGHVWLIDEIIAQISRVNSQQEVTVTDVMDKKNQVSTSNSHDLQQYLLEPENHDLLQDNASSCSDDELFSDVMSTITDVSTISLPREPSSLLPNPYPMPSGKINSGGKSDNQTSCDNDEALEEPTPTPQPRSLRSVPTITPQKHIEDRPMKKQVLNQELVLDGSAQNLENFQTSNELDEYGFTLTSSKPRRLRTQPETTKLNPSQPQTSTSPETSQDETARTKSPILVPHPKSPNNNSTDLSGAQDCSTAVEKHQQLLSNEDCSNTLPLAPSIIPNSSRRLEYRLARKQAEQFNEEAARLAIQEQKALFQKNEAEKVLNYSPDDAMFGNIGSNASQQDKIETFETRVRKQVNKKYLKEAKERPSLMDLYNKDDWEKEITLQSTGPRIIYSIGVDHFEKPSPHSKTENEYIRKYLKQNPIV